MLGTILLGAAAFVVMIVVVVGVHELGHFATAKWSGIRVDEFAIGFGPKLWTRRRGETDYSVRALPLGGFVKMPGMSALEEDDGGPRGFMHAPLPRQLVVLVAGVTMNFLLAGLLFGVLRTQGHDAASTANLPAATAGLRVGDQIVAIAGHTVDTSSQDTVAAALHDATDGGGGAPLAVTYRRTDGSTATTTIAPALVIADNDDSQPLQQADGQPSGFVVVDTVNGKPAGRGDAAAVLGGGGAVQFTGHTYGAAPGDRSAVVSGALERVEDGRGALGRVQAAWYVGYSPAQPGEALPSAMLHGFTTLPGEVAQRVRDIWDVFTTPNSGGVKNFQGPVGIARDASQAAEAGWMSYISLIALISLSLGIINILPIPPFDGGRVVLVLRQGIMRRGSGARLEMALVAAGALLIGTLAILITINDIRGF